MGYLNSYYPHCNEALADLFEPTVRGDFDAEEFLALDADAPWPREPLFPPGTLIEIGCFGSELFRIDSQTAQGWIGRWFTRWNVLAAFREWNGIAGQFALGNKGLPGDPSEFVLKPGYDEETCHRTGEAFAAVLQHCFCEGRTAPGVTVRYVRQSLKKIAP